MLTYLSSMIAHGGVVGLIGCSVRVCVTSKLPELAELGWGPCEGATAVTPPIE